IAFGAVISHVRSGLDGPVVESAIALIAPFVIYLVAELIHGSGVIAVVVAAGVPLVTLSGDPFPGRPHLVFLTFVVVVGTLLLHGLTLPWSSGCCTCRATTPQQDRLAAVQAQDRAARAAADRLDELLAESQDPGDTPERAAEVLRHWNTRHLNAAWERLGRTDEEIGESPAAAFRRLRLEMLAAERKTFIEERDAGRINDEVLRAMLHGLDLEEATLNRT
ncbi:MAG: hypothetical protein ACXWD8_01790, partial [Mycobacterium sp.]